jgi:hypothetical protein
MNKQQAIEVLKAHNEWRRDKGDTKNLTMHEPKVIGEAIDVAIAALSDAVTLPDVAMALEERDKLGFTVVEVIGKLDEINEQVEEITLHDVNYFAVPAELWHELQDALEHMPQRADLFTQHKVTLPDGWVAVPAEPTQDMCTKGQWKANEWKQFPLRIASIYKAMLQAAPTCEKES